MMRTVRVLLPQSIALRAPMTASRAAGLASRGTLSSRSSMTTSAGLRLALPCIPERWPGTERMDLLGAVMKWCPC